MARVRIPFLPLATLFFLAQAPALMAQRGTSRLEGTVKDSTGSVVAGAERGVAWFQALLV